MVLRPGLAVDHVGHCTGPCVSEGAVRLTGAFVETGAVDFASLKPDYYTHMHRDSRKQGPSLTKKANRKSIN